MEQRRCEECGDNLVGRSDKKFCSDECRVAFNNRRSRRELAIVLLINRKLKKNYIILDTLYSQGVKKTDLITLSKLGFDHSYCTSFRGGGRNHKQRSFCYDYSFGINKKLEVKIKKHIFV